MGSSRTVYSVRPEILSPLFAADGRQVLVFNGSHIAGGSAVSIMMLYERLRHAGIRPDYLVVEVLPACLTDAHPSVPFDWMTIADEPTLRPFFHPIEIGWRYVRPRVNACNNNRGELVHTFAPVLSDREATSNRFRKDVEALGGSRPNECMPISLTPEQVRQRTDAARAGYQPRLSRFAVAPNEVRAFDAILRTARADGTAAVLVLTPESSEYRNWYSATAEKDLADIMADARAEHGVPIINAREWLPDEDFYDGHHVMLSGADHFTRLLAERVLEPLVHDRLTYSVARK